VKKCARPAYISGWAANATTANLALYPLSMPAAAPGCPSDRRHQGGFSEGGASPNPGSHHPGTQQHRTHLCRLRPPPTAEVIQELGLPGVHLTITSVDMVRRRLAGGAHAFVKPGVTEKDLWKVYRQFADSEPFVAW